MATRRIDILTITISDLKSNEPYTVRIIPQGEAVLEIFDEGGQTWTNLKGAAHTLIDAMGDLSRGRVVTIRSGPPESDGR